MCDVHGDGFNFGFLFASDGVQRPLSCCLFCLVCSSFAQSEQVYRVVARKELALVLNRTLQNYMLLHSSPMLVEVLRRALTDIAAPTCATLASHNNNQHDVDIALNSLELLVVLGKDRKSLHAWSLSIMNALELADCRRGLLQVLESHVLLLIHMMASQEQAHFLETFLVVTSAPASETEVLLVWSILSTLVMAPNEFALVEFVLNCIRLHPESFFQAIGLGVKSAVQVFVCLVKNLMATQGTFSSSWLVFLERMGEVRGLGPSILDSPTPIIHDLISMLPGTLPILKSIVPALVPRFLEKMRDPVADNDHRETLALAFCRIVESPSLVSILTNDQVNYAFLGVVSVLAEDGAFPSTLSTLMIELLTHLASEPSTTSQAVDRFLHWILGHQDDRLHQLVSRHQAMFIILKIVPRISDAVRHSECLKWLEAKLRDPHYKAALSITEIQDIEYTILCILHSLVASQAMALDVVRLLLWSLDEFHFSKHYGFHCFLVKLHYHLHSAGDTSQLDTSMWEALVKKLQSHGYVHMLLSQRELVDPQLSRRVLVILCSSLQFRVSNEFLDVDLSCTERAFTPGLHLERIGSMASLTVVCLMMWDQVSPSRIHDILTPDIIAQWTQEASCSKYREEILSILILLLYEAPKDLLPSEWLEDTQVLASVMMKTKTCSLESKSRLMSALERTVGSHSSIRTLDLDAAYENWGMVSCIQVSLSLDSDQFLNEILQVCDESIFLAQIACSHLTCTKKTRAVLRWLLSLVQKPTKEPHQLAMIMTLVSSLAKSLPSSENPLLSVDEFSTLVKAMDTSPQALVCRMALLPLVLQNSSSFREPSHVEIAVYERLASKLTSQHNVDDLVWLTKCLEHNLLESGTSHLKWRRVLADLLCRHCCLDTNTGHQAPEFSMQVVQALLALERACGNKSDHILDERCYYGAFVMLTQTPVEKESNGLARLLTELMNLISIRTIHDDVGMSLLIVEYQACKNHQQHVQSLWLLLHVVVFRGGMREVPPRFLDAIQRHVLDESWYHPPQILLCILILVAIVHRVRGRAKGEMYEQIKHRFLTTCTLPEDGKPLEQTREMGVWIIPMVRDGWVLNHEVGTKLMSLGDLALTVSDEAKTMDTIHSVLMCIQRWV